MRTQDIVYCLFLIFLSSNLFGQDITGPDKSCVNSCHTYFIPSPTVGPFVWSVENGIVAEEFSETSIEICWEDEADGTIIIYDFSTAPASTLTLGVEIIALPKANILLPLYPDCHTRPDSTASQEDIQELICLSVCNGSVVSYSSPMIPDHTYDWQVIGGSLLSSNNNMAEIQWDESGPASLLLIEENALGCADSIKYCITIEKKLDLTIQSSTNDPICIGQSIYLTGSGTDLSYFEWQSSDGQFTFQNEATFQFPNAGIYDVLFIGGTDCSCYDTLSYQIEVASNPGPTIDCVGTSCAGASQTYFASDVCSQYNWSISVEGTIVSGGGNSDDFIEVIWNQGPVGTIGLSTAGCSMPICQEESLVQIPIISNGDPIIEGPTVSCKNGKDFFRVPSFHGVEYQWTVLGNGYIESGHGSNQIEVNWQESFGGDEATIILNYENCFLACGGTDTLQVQLLERFRLTGSSHACSGSNYFISAITPDWDNVPVDWTVQDESGNSIFSASNESFISYSFPDAGLYTITATEMTGAFCNQEEIGSITVVEAPSAPASIDGALSICKNVWYQYSYPVDNVNHRVSWIFNDGGPSTFNYGSETWYQWTSDGPYKISVFITDELNSCSSELLELDIQTISASDLIGANETCVDQIAEYEIAASNEISTNWMINPPEAGTILQNENSIEVLWHLPGTHNLSVDHCGQALNMDVTVNDAEAIVVNHPIAVCEGELAEINVTLPLGAQIEIRDETDNTISTDPITNVAPGYYYLEQVSADGCITKENIFIDSYHAPQIRISSPDPRFFCPPTGIRIYAFNTIEGLSYEWFKDGIPFASNVEIINVFESGIYTLESTTINGCVSTSNAMAITICCPAVEDCPSGPGIPAPACTPDGIIDFSFNQSAFCNTYSFTNESMNFQIGSLEYHFGDPFSTNNVTNNPNPNHTFTQAGFYDVILFGNVRSADNPNEFCAWGRWKSIEIPVVADFNYTPACATEELSFKDYSTYLADRSIVSHEWVFGDPSSGADNTSTQAEPKHIYNLPGKYMVTLTVESNTGCKSQITKEIEVKAGPDLDFSFSSSLCSNEAIQFLISTSSSSLNTVWNFGDPSSGSLNQSTAELSMHQFNGPGFYDVSVTSQNIFGCSSSITKTIEITDNNLSGVISLDQSLPICEGDSIQLTAPAGGSVYVWSNGSVGNTIKVADPGLYSVSVYGGSSCAYVPDPVAIEVIPKPFSEILGYVSDGFVNTDLFRNEMEVCEGDLFYFSHSFLTDYDVAWPNGFVSSIAYPINLGVQNPGVYELHLELTHQISACTFESEKFTLIVHPRPIAPVISSDQTDMCEGALFTFSVDNPDPDMQYFWNNGRTGTSLTTSVPGVYFVTAQSPFGCTTNSNSQRIHAKPDLSYFLQGCVELCLPDTLCNISSLNASNYQWLFNGSAIPGPEGQVADLVITEAGSYQLIAENIHGCIDTSNVLDVSLAPGLREMSGKVFIDNNNNGVYDTGEILLEDVTIYVTSGSTIIDSLGTDEDGEYLVMIDDLTDGVIEIDTQGLNLELINTDLFYFFNFTNCDENLIQDFPLNNQCVPLNNINMELTASCFSSATGSVTLMVNGTYQYALDGGPFQDDPSFDNLSAGFYQIVIKDPNGCESFADVIIAENENLNIAENAPELLCEEERIKLSVSMGDGQDDLQFIWSTGDTTEQIKIHEEGNYQLTVSDECSSMDFNWNITWPDEFQNSVYVPNIFTPNGDGNNDFFTMSHSNHMPIQNYRIEIFSRWGDLVFISENADQAWDGKFKNKECGTGVYVWVIRYDVEQCGKMKTKILHGDVAIML